MEIRRLGAEDYREILDLWNRAGLASLRPRGRDSLEAFTRQMATGYQTVLGLERDGRIVAVVVASHDGRKGWINRLAVDPSLRRQGSGGRLLSAAEAMLTSQGIEVVAALIESENTDSLRLFESAGFRVGGDILYLSKRSSREA